MAVPLIAFPFALGKTGNVVTLDDESEDYYAGELALLILTNAGERELVPDYGITDPAFQSFDEVEFISKVNLFGPPVVISDIAQDYASDELQIVTVEFDPVDELQDVSLADDDVDEAFYEEGF